MQREVRTRMKDGGHNYLRCSNCNVLLADAWVNYPGVTETWTIRAVNCPWCDLDPKTKPLGGSYEIEVKSGRQPGGQPRIMVGGIATPEPDNDDLSVGIMSTHAGFIDCDVKNNKITLKITRGASGNPVFDASLVRCEP